MNALDYSRIIQAVSFTAIQINSPRGRYWRARVNATGKLLEQHYATRPALWADLEKCAQLCGARFATDSLNA